MIVWCAVGAVGMSGRRSSSVLEFVEEKASGLDHRFVDAKAVVERAMAGTTTSDPDMDEIEGLLAETAAYMASRHPDYSRLAARLELSRLRRRSPCSFSETMLGFEQIDECFARALREDRAFAARVNSAALDESFEEGLDYFGFKTLERSYLLKRDNEVVERPSQLLLRVSLGIHRGWESEEQLDLAIETFKLMSQRYFIHASPTLFHSGMKKNHLASCFLLGPTPDSIEGIYESVRRCAMISKAAGGIGFSVADVRASGSSIRGTGGSSNGLVPMLRVFDATARYVDQGGGKRPGAFAAYIEPWHADIFDVLDLKKNHGKEERRARDLFYALWVPDLFMKRVEEDGEWSLMCPDECPGLTDCHSAEFDALYTEYERKGKARRTVKARKLWRAVLDAQIETGTPYMLYKDACNAKSNQKHLGTIKCSNLCCEIVEYSDPDEIAVCNLASIVLPACLDDGGRFDFDKLKAVTKVVAANLDTVVSASAYPNSEAKNGNMRHRPVGIGVQGLADLFAKLKMPFDSPEAKELNRHVFESIYFAALESSCERAEKLGPHSSFDGSPASRGVLQQDMWNCVDSDREDWVGLRRKIAKYGLRNSLLVAPMPTASTAQIVGCNECFEPYTSNLYARRVKAGEFVVANPHLVSDLADRGLWDDAMRQDLVRNEGSVASLDRVPEDLKAMYKTAWELKQRVLIDLAADRGPFVDQSQSLNAFIPQPDYDKLSSFHFYGWKKGLKTGMYYLRTKPAANALRFTLDPEQRQKSSSPSSSSSSVTRSKDEDDDDSNNGQLYDGPVCLSCSG